jgi:hypothetical protein
VNGIAEVMGPTISTVPCRVVISDNETILSALKQLHSDQLEQIDFNSFGLRNIVKSSQLASEVTFPLFKTLVNILNFQEGDELSVSRIFIFIYDF